jgi:general secretion pathway protein C
MQTPSSAWRELAQRYPRVAQSVPTYISCAIGLGIVVQLAMDALAVSTEVRQSPLDPGPAVVASVSHGAGIAPVINSHLFGFVPPRPPVAAEAPPTQQPLVLAGTIALADPRRGAAILGPDTHSTRVYFAEQPVPGGARLHAVYPDRVLLERNGVLETLFLPHNRLPGLLGAIPALPTVASLSGDDGEETAEDSVAKHRREAIALRNGILYEHPRVGELIHPMAKVGAGGEFTGMQIYPGISAPALEEVGLQQGDVVVAVNGTPLRTQQAGVAAFRSLESAPVAQLTVMRDGEQRQVTLNVAQLAADAQKALQENGVSPGTGDED